MITYCSGLLTYAVLLIDWLNSTDCGNDSIAFMLIYEMIHSSIFQA